MNFRSIQVIILSQIFVCSNLWGQNVQTPTAKPQSSSAPAIFGSFDDETRKAQINEALAHESKISMQQFDQNGRPLKGMTPVDMYGGALCDVPVNPPADDEIGSNPVKQSYICLPSKEELESFQKFLKETENAGATLADSNAKAATSKDGKVVFTRVGVEHSNDVCADCYLMNGKLSDDVGRTAGFAMDASIQSRGPEKGDNSDVSFRQSTVGFGQRVKVNGQSRDPQGRVYLRFLNMTNQEFEKSTPVSNVGGPFEASYVRKFGFETQTGVKSESTAMQVQDAWHQRVHKPSGGSNGLVYNYVDQPGLDRTFLTAMAGLKGKAQGNIGNFHCMATGTALVGADTDGRAVAEGRLEAQLSTGTMRGRNVENPYAAIVAWASRQVRSSSPNNDNRGEVGVKVAGSMQVSRNVFVEASIARVYYVSAPDKVYSVGAKDGNEAQTVYALAVIFKN